MISPKAIAAAWLISVLCAYLIGLNQHPAKVATQIATVNEGIKGSVVAPKGASLSQKNTKIAKNGSTTIAESKIDFLSADRIDLEAWQNSLKEKQVVTNKLMRVNLLGTYDSDHKVGVELNGSYDIWAASFWTNKDRSWRVGAGLGVNF